MLALCVLIMVCGFNIQTRAIRGHLARGRRRMRMEDKDKLTSLYLREIGVQRAIRTAAIIGVIAFLVRSRNQYLVLL